MNSGAAPETLSVPLGGSWVVISRVISRVTILVTHIRGLITPLITTPEPPSKLLLWMTSHYRKPARGSSEVSAFWNVLRAKGCPSVRSTPTAPARMCKNPMHLLPLCDTYLCFGVPYFNTFFLKEPL